MEQVGDESYQMPPRFSPDNSPAARAQRLREFSAATVTELPVRRHATTRDTFLGSTAYDHSLAYVPPPLAEVTPIRPEPPEDIVA